MTIEGLDPWNRIDSLIFIAPSRLLPADAQIPDLLIERHR
jgi:hypothetical protein